MASLTDLYAPPSATPGAFIQAGLNQSAANASEDAGLSMARMRRQFETRTLPDIADSFASSGSFFSGATGLAADRAKESYANDSGDIERLLNRHLADLSRQRVLASMGISI